MRSALDDPIFSRRSGVFLVLCTSHEKRVVVALRVYQVAIRGNPVCFCVFGRVQLVSN
jgi:hypothetical protein